MAIDQQIKEVTDAQRKALTWLKEHGGSGAQSRKRGKVQYLVAAGEIVPFMPETWRGLADAGL